MSDFKESACQIIYRQGYEEGFKEGYEEGLKIGKEEFRKTLQKRIKKNLAYDVSPEDIAKALNLPLEEVLELA